jgi:hypothetical protein
MRFEVFTGVRVQIVVLWVASTGKASSSKIMVTT